jgi:hypothetical protein
MDANRGTTSDARLIIFDPTNAQATTHPNIATCLTQRHGQVASRHNADRTPPDLDIRRLVSH